MNRQAVRETPLPSASVVFSQATHADFADCYTLADPVPDGSAMDSYLALMTQAPVWMDTLMRLRNRVVKHLGLKDLGNLSLPIDILHSADYSVGQRIGTFTVEHISPNEVIVGDEDKHLHVSISVYKHVVADVHPLVSVSTVVHIHNTLGRLYMAVVGPTHRCIVPRMLSQSLIRATSQKKRHAR